jgi:hypothetical protein
MYLEEAKLNLKRAEKDIEFLEKYILMVKWMQEGIQFYSSMLNDYLPLKTLIKFGKEKSIYETGLQRINKIYYNKFGVKDGN